VAGQVARQDLSGLSDAPNGGVLAALDQWPPSSYARGDGTLLTCALGDISKQQIWRMLRRHETSLAPRRSWCISTDPAFAHKATHVVGCI
jgi:hypothetical protein